MMQWARRDSREERGVRKNEGRDERERREVRDKEKTCKGIEKKWELEF